MPTSTITAGKKGDSQHYVEGKNKCWFCYSSKMIQTAQRKATKLAKAAADAAEPDKELWLDAAWVAKKRNPKWYQI